MARVPVELPPVAVRLLQFVFGLLCGRLDAGRRADHGGVVLGQPRFQAGHLGGDVLLGLEGRFQGCPIAFAASKA